MSARREHRLRNLERRVAELETIAATPVFIHTKGDGGRGLRFGSRVEQGGSRHPPRQAAEPAGPAQKYLYWRT